MKPSVFSKYADSAKSELSHPNGTTGNTHVHPRSHSEQSSVAEKLSHTLSEKNKIKKSYFYSGSLGNTWGFPCFHGDDEQELWSQRETEINTTASPAVEII